MPRIDVAVIHRDGSAELVNMMRPAGLVAFSDAHDGKEMAETVPEIAWLAHRNLGVEQPLDAWLDGVETLSVYPADVALARRIIDGDEDARRIALGELPDEAGGALVDRVIAGIESGLGPAAVNGGEPDPQQAAAATAGESESRS